MPTNSGNTWFCSLCGMGGFRDFHEAEVHEMACDASRKRRRPGSPNDFYQPMDRNYPYYNPNKRHEPYALSATKQQEKHTSPSSNIISQEPSPTTATSFVPFTVLSPSKPPTEKLSELDTLTCENVECFQATLEDASDYEGGASGGMCVNVGQVGFRCIYCANSPFAKAEFSAVFPAAIGSVSKSLKMMRETHFENCKKLPAHVQATIQRAKSSVEEEWSRRVFVEFCINFCKRSNIVNRAPAQTGIVFQANKALPSTNNSLNLSTQNGTDQSPQQPIKQQSDSTPPDMLPQGQNRLQVQYGSSPQDSQGMLPNLSTASYTTPYAQGTRDKLPQSQIQDTDPTSAYASRNLLHQTSQLSQGQKSSPPMLYDSPTTPTFPYFQDNTYGHWHCKHCYQFSTAHKAPGHVWQSQTPPNKGFIDQHLIQCRGYNPNYQDGLSSASNVPSPQDSFMPQSTKHGAGYGAPISWGGSPQKQTNLHTNFYGGSQPAPSPISSQRPPLPNRPSLQGQSPQQGYGTSPNQQYQQQQQQQHYQTYQHQMYPHSGQTYPQQQQSDFYDNSQNMIHLPAEAPRYMGGHQQDQSYPGSEATMRAARDYLNTTYTKRDEEDTQEREEIEIQEEGQAPGSNMKCDLILPEDKQLLTDYFYHVMMQLRPCRFTEKDRKTRGGKRENIKVGYPGLMCVHCMKNPNSRKFFWSNVDRLANSFAEIPGHVLKCRRCPNQTKQALQELKQGHSDQMSQLPRGSQKVFFRRMWRRLHNDKDSVLKDADTPEKSSDKESSDNRSATAEITKTGSGSDSDATGNTGRIRASSSGSTAPLVAEAPSDDTETRTSPSTLSIGLSTKDAAKALSDSDCDPSSNPPRISLAIDEDKQWLSDMDCFVRENIEVFCAKVSDIEKAQSDRKYPVTLGQVGIRCFHCATAKGVQERGGLSQDIAVSFPYSISGIYESVREFQRLHLDSCPSIPKETKDKLDSLKGPSSLSSVLRRYYVSAAKALGLHDTNDGIRAGGVSICPTVPGSVAASRGNAGSSSGSSVLTDAIRITEQANMSFINASPVPKLLGGKKRDHTEI